MMAVNRYRIKTRAEKGNRSAMLVLKLLEAPDKLLGFCGVNLRRSRAKDTGSNTP